MSNDSTIAFARLMALYKELIILREKECDELKTIFLREAQKQNHRSIFCKSFIIIAGALVATKGVIDLIVLRLDWSKEVEMMMLMIYTIIGVVVAGVAGLDAAFRFESKTTRLNYLATMCQNHNAAYMAAYLKYLTSSPNHAIVQ